MTRSREGSDDARAGAAGERAPVALGAGPATLAVVGAAFGFATIAIATVLATRAGTPLVTLLLGRYVVGALALLPIVGSVAALRIGRRRFLQLLVAGGIGQGMVATLSLSALAYIPAASLVFLFYTFPAWVAIFARIRGTERIGPRRVVALTIALAGIVTMVGLPGSAALHPTGVALGLAGALAYGIYVPMLGHIQRGVAAPVSTFLVSVGVAILLLVAGLIRGDLAAPLPAVAWWSMLWLGVVSTAAAFILFLRGLATLGPVRTSIVSTAEPFFVAILGALLLDQPITLPVLTGGAFIALAVLLLQRPEPAPPP